MDSLTQIVLGSSVGELCLGRKIGNKAILWGGIAGTLPDLDVFFTGFFDPANAVMVHRGFSHSLAFAMISAPLLGWLINKLYRHEQEANFKEWSWFFFWTIFTHPLLDALTNWGTQLFWPFEWRISINSVFIIDPFYTLPFLILLVVLSFLKRENPRRKRLNKISIYISTAYLCLGLVIKPFIGKVFREDLTKRGIEVERMETRTMPFTILYWGMIAEGKEHYYSSYYSVFWDSPQLFTQHDKQHDLEEISEWKDSRELNALKLFSKGYYRLELSGDTLHFQNLRFGFLDGMDPQLPAKAFFNFKIYRDTKGNPVIDRERGGNFDMGEAIRNYPGLVFHEPR